MPPGGSPLARERARLAAEREAADARRERFLERLGSIVLAAVLLYVFIGNRPWSHGFVLDPSTGGTMMSPVNRYIWLGLLALASPLLWVQRGTLFGRAKAIWPWLLLFAWFGLSTSWALDHAASSRRFFLYAIDLAICIAIAGALPRDGEAHRVVALACVAIVLIDLATWIVAPGVAMTDLGLAAIHNHKNTLGVVMLFCGVALACWLPGRPTRAGRLGCLAAMAGLLALLVASQSKTSLGILLGYIVLLPAVVWLLRLPRVRLAGVALLVLALVLALAQSWIAWSFLHGQDPFGFAGKLTFTERRDVWRFVIGEALKSPWRGVGFSSFWDIDPQIQPSLKTGLWFAQADSPTNEAHNGYLDLWVTVGWIGLALALWVVARWVGRSVRLARDALKDGAPLSPESCHRLFLATLPLVIVAHNFLESSLFSSAHLFGLLALYVGVDTDLRFRAAREGAG